MFPKWMLEVWFLQPISYLHFPYLLYKYSFIKGEALTSSALGGLVIIENRPAGLSLV